MPGNGPFSESSFVAWATQAMNAAYDRYGRFGLLIDDAHLAAQRVARALYGTPCLPSWWVVVDFHEGARLMLDVVAEEFAANPTRPTIIVCDRFLKCRDPTGDVVAIDDESNAERRGARASLRRLVNAGSRSNSALHVVLITSYPGPAPARPTPLRYTIGGAVEGTDQRVDEGQAGELPWHDLALEALDAKRRELCTFRSPDQRAVTDVSDGASEEIGGEAKVADTNSRSPLLMFGSEAQIESTTSLVARWLIDGDHVILLTGAGCSIRATPVSPGLPGHDILLELACAAMLERLAPARGEELDAEDDRVFEAFCKSTQVEGLKTEAPQWAERIRKAALAGGRANDSSVSYEPVSGAPRSTRRASPSVAESWPLPSLVGHLAMGTRAREIKWRLETVFGTPEPGVEDGSHAYAGIFHQEFRRALHEWDEGFTFAHYVFARLPVSEIVTTNFDTFHEQAALAAVRVCEADQRAETIARGNAKVSGEGIGLDESRLTKPYGTLFSPSQIAMSRREIEMCGQRVQDALLRAFSRDLRTLQESAPTEMKRYDRAKAGREIAREPRVRLVVVGHSLNDTTLDAAFATLARSMKSVDTASIVWVDRFADAKLGGVVREAAELAKEEGREVGHHVEVWTQRRSGDHSADVRPLRSFNRLILEQCVEIPPCSSTEGSRSSGAQPRGGASKPATALECVVEERVPGDGMNQRSDSAPPSHPPSLMCEHVFRRPAGRSTVGDFLVPMLNECADGFAHDLWHEFVRLRALQPTQS